ncbi:MAG: DUF370 domain-containing protein [Candidatus Sericytochromatia bacterium]|nr:DUF370 domain-containing protein [Candidatus Sericytochromatia bacterium]
MSLPALLHPLVHLGHGHTVAAACVVAIIDPDSAPVKRLISEAQAAGTLVDATAGRKARAVVITDGAGVHLAAVQPETLAQRYVRREMVE